MARLTAKGRKALPSSDFAVPGKRAYPMQDRGHAQAALGRAQQFGTPAVKSAVRAKAASKFGMGKKVKRKAKKKMAMPRGPVGGLMNQDGMGY